MSRIDHELPTLRNKGSMYSISDEKHAEGPIIYNLPEGKVDIGGAALTIGARIKL